MKPEVKAVRNEAWAQIRTLRKLLEKLPGFNHDCDCTYPAFVSLDFFVDNPSDPCIDIYCLKCGGTPH